MRNKRFRMRVGRRDISDRGITAFAKFYGGIRARFRQCPDTEVEQNLVRGANIIVCTICASVYSVVTGVYVPTLFIVASSLLLYAAVIFIWIYLSPSKSVLRRLFHLFGDNAAVTWALVTYGEMLSPAYILYISINIGYGARFGRPYLYLSTAFSLIGFGIVVLYNDYWRSLMPISIGLWIGILVLPYYAGLFYKRLTAVNNRLHDLATRDTLTGLPNRPFLYERLQEAIATAERHNRRFAVLFVDIDNFKRINDTHGHEAGDAALRATARILRDSVRKADTVARLGGDEFVILLNETRGSNAQIAENLRDALTAYTPHLSASIGIATYPDCGTDAETLVRHADHAMYEAKRAGKNRWSVCPDAYGYVRSVEPLRREADR